MELSNINWNQKTYKEYVNFLLSLKNENNIKFSKRIIDTKYEMLGIKIPILRSVAKDIVKGNYLRFLKISKHQYYEEVMIKGFVIAYSKNKDILDEFIFEYMDEIDNWSLCDSFTSTLKFIKNDKKYFNFFKNLTKYKEEYYVRVGLTTILFNYINDENIDDILIMIDKIKLKDYYVKMAIAWLMCECFIKQKDKTLIYIKNNKLDNFTFNKFVCKCIDSYRISKEDKKYLKSLKRKDDK